METSSIECSMILSIALVSLQVAASTVSVRAGLVFVGVA